MLVPARCNLLASSCRNQLKAPNPDVIASPTLSQRVARSYTRTSLFGEFTGRVVGTSLGSANRATPTIAKPHRCTTWR